MDFQDNPIEGFVRRPKRPIRIMDIIEISDDDSGGEPNIPQNQNSGPIVKCEATENETTGSEIMIPDEINTEKKKRKKKRMSKRSKREYKEAVKKLKRKFKKEHVSEESSDSDSDSSNQKRVKHKSESSCLSSSSSGSDSDSDSSDCNSRRKKNHRRSKKSRRNGKKRHSSSKINRKTKRGRNSKRLKREKESTDETTSSDNPSSPDNSNPSISSNNGQNNSNQVPNDNSRFVGVEAGTSFQSYPWHRNSQHNSAIPVLPGNGPRKLDQIVPLAEYVDDEEMAGTSQTSPMLEDFSEIIIQSMADHQDNTTQVLDPNSSNIENFNEQQFIDNLISIVHISEIDNDQNDLPRLNSSNESDTEQQVEQLPEINVGRSGGRPYMNLQRPRPNTDKMLYLTNPERANVCVFCYDSYTNIVNHYKRKHRSEEVYVSRISPKMANRLKGDDFERFEAKCDKRGSFWKLHAKCFFCEYPRAFNLSYWIDHIRVHTGEYGRLCTSCGANVTSHGHCGIATEIVRTHNLTTDDLMCFVCKLCNFVQIEQKNMERHLLKQHDIQENELMNEYDKRVLLPSKNTVCNGRVAATAQGANSIAAINEQENARKIRVLNEVILNPFNNGISEPNAPVPNTPEQNIPASNTPEPDEPNQLGPKREKEWDQRTYQRYIRDDDNKIVVNPWLENKTRKKNIFPANLFDFYKCMHPNCIFSTNEKMDMHHHVKDHYAHIDIGVSKEHPIDIHKKSRDCPYCYLTSFKSVNDLFQHMESMHSSCTYQCSHCYYRCIEMDSIVMHYKEFHPNKLKNIYIVNSERKFCGDQMDRMLDGEYVHRKQFHEFMCSYCNDFGSSQVDDMKKHLAKHHSSEFMFVLTRAGKDEYIYVGEMLDWTNYKFFKCGKYQAMSKYLDWDQHNISDQPDPFPLVPVLGADFEFEPSKLQLADDVLESKFVYRKYDDYRNSQTVLFRCGRYTPEYLIANPDAQGSICRICSIYVKGDSLPHLEEHQKTYCYFTSDREDLILQHMEKKHRNDIQFFYRKCERKGILWKERSMKCLFACGICAQEKFACFRTAREHHKTTHPNDVEVIQIERFLADKKVSNDTFSFIAYKFCAEPRIIQNNIPVYRKECSLPMTTDTLKAHHESYHASTQQQRQEQQEEERNQKKIIKYGTKLVLCKNNEITK